MWENVTNIQAGAEEPADLKAARNKSAEPCRKDAKQAGDSYLLWAQILLCAMVLAGVLAAHYLKLPVYSQLRVAFTQAMTTTETDYLGETRKFVKFTQQTWQSLTEAAQEVFAPKAEVPELTVSSVMNRARHGKTEAETEAPAGCCLENGEPEVSLSSPLKTGLSITSTYGWRTNPLEEESEDFHTGVDLSAAEGTPVYAAAAGIVRQTGCGKSYGNYVRILHKGGDETLYAHLQYLFVRAGQTVEQGSCIAASGATGNVTGPHLHFELLQGGIRYDPSEALGLS